MPVRKGQKIKQPKNRRSPVKHTVKAHTRYGRPVRSFTRGSGVRPKRSQRSRVVGRVVDDDVKIGVHAFTANFRYSDKPGDGESVIVFSDNYVDAADEAWEERTDTRVPISVEVVDPDIGAALKWFGERAKAGYEYGKPKISKAAKLGAKYAIRAGKAGVSVGKETYKLAAFGAQQKLVESLLKLCFQPDRAKRIAARAALRKRYPSIYAQCSFSRERW